MRINRQYGVRMGEINNRVRYHASEASKHSEAAVAAMASMTQEQRVFHTQIVEDTKIVNDKTTELIFLMRSELALGTSLEDLVKTNAAMYAAATASLAQVNAAIDARSKESKESKESKDG